MWTTEYPKESGFYFFHSIGRDLDLPFDALKAKGYINIAYINVKDEYPITVVGSEQIFRYKNENSSRTWLWWHESIQQPNMLSQEEIQKIWESSKDFEKCVKIIEECKNGR